jgi:hypothetical protein
MGRQMPFFTRCILLLLPSKSLMSAHDGLAGDRIRARHRLQKYQPPNSENRVGAAVVAALEGLPDTDVFFCEGRRATQEGRTGAITGYQHAASRQA